MKTIIGVRFRKAGKIYYFEPNGLEVEVGQHVIVETSRGVEYGTVVLSPREVSDEAISSPLKIRRSLSGCRTIPLYPL